MLNFFDIIKIVSISTLSYFILTKINDISQRKIDKKFILLDNVNSYSQARIINILDDINSVSDRNVSVAKV